MNKNTVNALIARGIDSTFAANLSAKKHTISSLKQLSEGDLIGLGFSAEKANELLRESRPPVPEETLLRLLYKSRRTCCICRDPKKSVVVHHIEEWSSSRSHAEENLIVLCLEHHDLAHTKRELSQTLSKAELLAAKKNWSRDVEILDAKTILSLKNSHNASRWDWVNIQRIFEIAVSKNISCRIRKIEIYLQSHGYIDENGALATTGKWAQFNSKGFWFTDFSDGMYISAYLSDIVDQVLLSTPVIDITPLIFSRKELRSVISEGDYFVAQLPFYFSDIDKFEKGKTQMRRS
ncbi:HNH endonuclease signature motif containing protein [Alcaligenes faecalis]|uniref:HNH endonuclease signature motif containing protein n=1 Tax=Alcaligenes faecalis TaxID=511 RepID=UPI00122C8FEE|nr:HNH endonuclease signature motif containing protein [Alcaligenes faecalis]